MTTIYTTTLTPASGKLMKATATAVRIASIARRHAPKTTLWQVAVGGPATLDRQLITESESFAEGMASRAAIFADPDFVAILQELESDAMPFATPAPSRLGELIYGDGTTTSASPRMAMASVLAATTEVLALAGTFTDLVHGHGGECSVIRWTVAGIAPLTVSIGMVFPDAATMDAITTAIRQTTTYQDIMSKVGAAVLGRSVLTELAIP